MLRRRRQRQTGRAPLAFPTLVNEGLSGNYPDFPRGHTWEQLLDEADELFDAYAAGQVAQEPRSAASSRLQG